MSQAAPDAICVTTTQQRNLSWAVPVDFLRAQSAGGKFRLDGVQGLQPLGSFPEVTLADARHAHAASRKLVTKGVHPGEPRRENAWWSMRWHSAAGARRRRDDPSRRGHRAASRSSSSASDWGGGRTTGVPAGRSGRWPRPTGPKSTRSSPSCRASGPPGRTWCMAATATTGPTVRSPTRWRPSYRCEAARDTLHAGPGSLR